MEGIHHLESFEEGAYADVDIFSCHIFGLCCAELRNNSTKNDGVEAYIFDHSKYLEQGETGCLPERQEYCTEIEEH